MSFSNVPLETLHHTLNRIKRAIVGGQRCNSPERLAAIVEAAGERDYERGRLALLSTDQLLWILDSSGKYEVTLEFERETRRFKSVLRDMHSGRADSVVYGIDEYSADQGMRLAVLSWVYHLKGLI